MNCTSKPGGVGSSGTQIETTWDPSTLQYGWSWCHGVTGTVAVVVEVVEGSLAVAVVVAVVETEAAFLLLPKVLIVQKTDILRPHECSCDGGDG